jgi:hypothetical protein
MNQRNKNLVLRKHFLKNNPLAKLTKERRRLKLIKLEMKKEILQWQPMKFRS